MSPGTGLPHAVRISARARRVSLRVTLRGGLEVVLPRGVDPAGVPDVLERHAEWIRAALARAEAERRDRPPEPAWQIPSRIALPAVGETWEVSARGTAARGVSVRQDGRSQLVLLGRIHDAPACRAALARWLVRQGDAHLPARLLEKSRHLGLRFTRVSVRLQRSRWGSCSRAGAISLNARLLLLPVELLDYVLLHELCHTAIPNHSPAFWRLLERHCPDHRALRAALRAAGRLVPAWASGIGRESMSRGSGRRRSGGNPSGW